MEESLAGCHSRILGKGDLGKKTGLCTGSVSSLKVLLKLLSHLTAKGLGHAHFDFTPNPDSAPDVVLHSSCVVLTLLFISASFVHPIPRLSEQDETPRRVS